MKAMKTGIWSKKQGAPMSGIDAAMLILAAGIGAVGTTAMTIAGLLNLTAGPTTLRLPADIGGASPQPPPHTAADIVSSARVTEMEVTLRQVPGAEASLLAWSAVLNQACLLAVAALVVFLCLRLRREWLFTSAAAWAIGLCGAVLAFAGPAAQILNGTARGRLVENLTGATGAGDAVYVTDFNFGTLIAGVVMVLFAAAFQMGSRLQKDTEGLV